MRILVIGAGPAGLSAALRASEEGHEVAVFEMQSRAGVKICGEALGREALNYIGIAPSKKFIVNEVKGFSISFRGKYLREADFKNFPYAPGYMVDKPAFLEMISEKAASNGAKLFFNTRVNEIDPQTGKIRLEDSRILQGDLIICADGLGGLARKYFNRSNHETAICVQCRCSLPKELDPKYLYLDIIGEGYAWTFLKGNCANIGIGLLRSSFSNEFLRKYLDKYIERLGAKKLGGITGAPVFIGGPLKDFSVGKAVVAGEAAGCVMPLSGEGNRFSIFAGSIAYKPNYQRMFMEKYGGKILTSKKILRLVRALKDAERIELLKCLSDPLKILEGNWPNVSDFLSKPKLLIKLIQKRIEFL